MSSSDLRYPVGNFEARNKITSDERRALIGMIADAPRNLRGAVANLNERQLDTPYRDGGWTVRQVAHHVPDSHLNAYTRLKLALTEDEPTIKPYEEARWAELADSRETPIEVSLTLLDSLTTRWVTLLNSMTENDFARKFRHPDHGAVDVDWLVQMYGWHSRHHVAHITSLRARNGW
ncbi:MAG TPA: putative metal-dependent hydrolase [Thermoanaerobaculia bacterium]|nr:putative metal-dependent hydrolase [Thermoanaerobaculia bacterium]